MMTMSHGDRNGTASSEGWVLWVLIRAYKQVIERVSLRFEIRN